MVLLRGLVACLLFLGTAHAGGRGGHVTAWDPNLFPGATITTINCNGATDSAALAAFVTAGVAANPALQVLRLVGQVCNFESNNALQWNGTIGGPSVKHSITWAYGVKITGGAYVGADGIYQDNTHNAKIQSATAGATTVTLVTAAEATRFSVGDWVLVAGLELQNRGSTTGGYPPNWQFFEYKLVTANSGTGTGIITFSEALKNSYLSTWPVTFAGSGSYPQTGPASIYTLPPGWNLNAKLFGMEMPSSPAQVQVTVSGRDIAAMDVVWHGHSPALSHNLNVSLLFNNFGSDAANDQAEIDKNIDFVRIHRSFGNQLFFQSAGVNNLSITSSKLTTLNGSGINTVIDSSVIDAFSMGPVFFGHGVSITAANSTINTASPSNQFVDKSIFSYATGTFSIANASAPTAWQWGVPGMKYNFVFYSGGYSFCNNPFTITAVTQDGTNTNYVTDLVGALPTPSCGGNLYNKYLAYPAATITQRFTGPANLTQYAAP